MPGGSSQKTRFASARVSSIWSNVVARLTPPSHPSTTSESAMDSSANRTDTYYGEGSMDHSHPLQLLDPSAHPSKHVRLRRPGSRKKGGKSSGAASTSRYGDDDDPNAIYEPVSHCVVENNFEEFTPPPPRSDSGASGRTPGRHTMHSGGTNGTTAANVEGDQLEGLEDPSWGKSGEDMPDRERHQTRSEVSAYDHAKSWMQSVPGYEFTVERAWPNIKHFFDSSYPEPSKESSFQKEAWFNQKQGAFLSSVYFTISWALTVGLLPLPFSKFNWWAYLGLAGSCILPTTVLVIFDIPRRHPAIWQPVLFAATWVMSDILIGEMYECNFFGGVNNRCGTRNFLNFSGFGFGLPTLAVLAMRQNRIMAAFGCVQWLVLVGVLLVHQGHAPRLFYRNMVNFGLFHCFLIGTSFLKERSDRQMFSLRQQLKIQYRATQSAQVMERRASDSKKRFVSYIFHEVRVPLNTALLAVQNLEGENVFKGLAGDQSEMVHGLMGSLTMMEKVLNDVLSFNRMESGKFAQARKPFEFHKSIQLVALSHRMQAQMAGIDLIVELDKDIDKIGGMFIGDEMRLRQVASNLVSNSIKFTDTGSVRIVTKLLYPRLESTPAIEMDDPLRQAAVNLQAAQDMEHATRMERLGSLANVDPEKGSVAAESARMSRDSTGIREKDERHEEPRVTRKAVVRVEVHDTGVGLKKNDVIDNRLFSPYVQTEIGRRQGGKGSGLGLALVRQIVKLSNGRLGVESQYGKGSMFWFELPYSLPSPKTRSRETSVPPSVSGGGGGGGGGGGMGSSPMASRTPTMGAATPALGMIKESSSHGDTPEGGVEEKQDRHVESRPAMVTTESTMPLLSDRRRSSSIANEGLLSTSFPAVDCSPEKEIPSENVFVTVPANRDPFRAESVGRRSSEASDGVIATSASTSYLQPEMTRAAGELKAKTKLPANGEPPLCTLVVDDDKLTRMLMSRMLTRLGHQVTTAENGKIAFDMISDSFEGQETAPKFDIVFLDNQMPLMSGVEVAREVREMGCPLYIVGCTGNALREDQDEYMGAGADEIITKPIHQKAVEESIKNARKRIRGETAPKDLEAEASRYERG